ncbi:MAG: hypothetical protein H0T96_09750 [Thermoleophilaceae bacterium]|nr:hypothetical protein [Thermoleophilaceae bacterium]
MVALGALVLAAPAAAGKRQEASISQSCNGGDSDGDSDGDSSSSSSSSSDSGSCRSQRRVVQQSGGGSNSRSINQSQSFGDDDRGRVRRDRDRDRDDFKVEQSASVSEEDFSCGDFSSQAAAQVVLEENSDDPFGLDDDNDGRACEEEFTQAVSGAPEGGVETGGGGTLARAADGRSGDLAQVAKLAGPPLALALLVAGLLGLRRGRTA